jgi:DNA-binding NarL/FixJ family response regulator
VGKAFVNGKNGLTREESIEVDAALNDIAVRLERAAEAVARLTQLSRPEATPKKLDLTERELEILGQLADGKTNREIAAHCWISNNTVKFHVKNLFRKLAVRNRGQAMMIAKGVRHVINSAA